VTLDLLSPEDSVWDGFLVDHITPKRRQYIPGKRSGIFPATWVMKQPTTYHQNQNNPLMFVLKPLLLLHFVL